MEEGELAEGLREGDEQGEAVFGRGGEEGGEVVKDEEGGVRGWEIGGGVEEEGEEVGEGGEVGVVELKERVLLGWRV